MTTHIHRKLYRSSDDRILAGVCGGIAEYFDIDPVLVRIASVLLGMGGMGIFAYIILALIVPAHGSSTHGVHDTAEKASEFVEGAAEKVKEVFQDIGANSKGSRQTGHGRNAIGAIIIGIGVIALLNQIFPSLWFRWHMIWPLALVLAGFWIIKSRD